MRNGKKYKNDLAKDNLKGKVKLFTETIDGIICESYKYDEIGNQIEWNWYDSGGSLIEKETYKYDKSGNRVECSESEQYEYDESGNLIEMNSYDSDGKLMFNNKYIYDESGNLIERISYLVPFEDSFEKETYKFDENGNQIEWSKYVNGKLDIRKNYDYDANGNQIAKNYYNSDGRLFYKYTSKYDECGNEIEWREYAQFDYDEKGYLVTSAHPLYGIVDLIAFGIHEYDYDKSGNWIKKTSKESPRNEKRIAKVIFFNFEIIENSKFITEREYEYYK